MKFIRSQKAASALAPLFFRSATRKWNGCWRPEVLSATGFELPPHHRGRRRGNHSRTKMAGRSHGAAPLPSILGKLEKFFSSPGRFRLESPDQFRFTLTGEQMEWLLQVLNDMRVGCWVKLGRPELEPAPPRKLRRRESPPPCPPSNSSGFFQMVLLGAYEGPGLAVRSPGAAPTVGRDLVQP